MSSLFSFSNIGEQQVARLPVVCFIMPESAQILSFLGYWLLEESK